MESCRTRTRPYWGSPGIREQDRTNTGVCCSDKAPSLPPPLLIRLISTDIRTFDFFCVKNILNFKQRSVLLSASEHSWYDQFRREDITCCYDVSPYCLTVFNPEWETDWIILQMLASAVLGAHGNLTKLALFSCRGRAEKTCEMMHDGSVTETEIYYYKHRNCCATFSWVIFIHHVLHYILFYRRFLWETLWK